jgi:hypothetical protein
VASVSRPSRSRSEAGASAPLAVYLLPAVVGGGRGDIEDLRAVGWAMTRSGAPLLLPVGVRGTPSLRARELVDWPLVRREPRIVRRARRAMTVVPQFGVTSAPARPGPLGRPGPWADVVSAIETEYGADQVVHVSLEEFGRNLSAEEQEAERWREGGRTARRQRSVRRTAAWRRDVARMRRLWRHYHLLDRPNLLHLQPTFVPSRACRRDFPELLECGPIPPPTRRPARRPRPSTRHVGAAQWVWYASPSTSPVLLEGLAEGARRAGRPLRIEVHTPRPFPPGPLPPGLELAWGSDLGRAEWERTFRGAELRIVTGSRSLLEALALGGPFLYFHGAAGRGAARRVHRPEKLRRLLALWRSVGVAAALRRDLADFARARRVGEIVATALTDPAWASGFPWRPIPPTVPSYRRDGGALLRRIAGEWADTSETAGAFVRRWRAVPGD